MQTGPFLKLLLKLAILFLKPRFQLRSLLSPPILQGLLLQLRLFRRLVVLLDCKLEALNFLVALLHTSIGFLQGLLKLPSAALLLLQRPPQHVTFPLEGVALLLGVLRLGVELADLPLHALDQGLGLLIILPDEVPPVLLGLCHGLGDLGFSLRLRFSQCSPSLSQLLFQLGTSLLVALVLAGKLLPLRLPRRRLLPLSRRHLRHRLPR
mmetsp:Transcript_77837/g.207979  ORF Transcript_77837/g.207979 Transcript_77837/m.207979 type:complete len:209 (-) Transcript_77837:82-708(-)